MKKHLLYAALALAFVWAFLSMFNPVAKDNLSFDTTTTVNGIMYSVTVTPGKRQLYVSGFLPGYLILEKDGYVLTQHLPFSPKGDFGFIYTDPATPEQILLYRKFFPS